jgi:putative endonuclease
LRNSLAGNENRVKLAKSRKAKDSDAETKSYYVYMLLCDDGSYYTGYTNDVASRIERHKKGFGARYTKMRRPKRLVHVEKFGTRGAAIRRERQIKTLSHREKYELVSIRSHTKSDLG